MAYKKPNHICKHCGAAYYACNDCDSRKSWRAVACCEECYSEYLNAVAISRGSRTVEEDEYQPSLYDSLSVESNKASPGSMSADNKNGNVQYTGFRKKKKRH